MHACRLSIKMLVALSTTAPLFKFQDIQAMFTSSTKPAAVHDALMSCYTLSAVVCNTASAVAMHSILFYPIVWPKLWHCLESTSGNKGNNARVNGSPLCVYPCP